MQVPTGAAEDRVRAAQKEGHDAKDLVYQLHAIPGGEKGKKVEHTRLLTVVLPTVLATLKEALLLALQGEKNEPRN